MDTNHNIPAELIKPHYSTKLIRSIHNYFIKYYSEEMFNKILEDLGLSRDYFLDDDNWHSNDINKKICDKIIEETGDEKILFNIGKDLLQPQNINFLEYQFIKILPPYFLFINLPQQAAKINNIFKMEVLKAKPGNITYRIKKPLEQPHPGAFQNTEGCFYAFKDFCNLTKFELKVESCISRGDDETIYSLKYSAIRYWLYKIVPFSLLLILGTFLTSSLIQNTKDLRFLATVATTGSFILAGFLALVVSNFFKMLKNSQLYYDSTREKNQKIYEKTNLLETRLKEAKYIKEMCIKLVKSKKPEEIISESLDLMTTNSKFSKAIALVVNEKEGKLKTAALRGFNQNSNQLLSLEVSYPADAKENLFFSNILDNGKTVHISDIEAFKTRLKPENQKIIDTFGVTSIIVSPLQDNDKKFGLLVVGTTHIDNKFDESDVLFIEHISSLMSLFFQKSYTLETESALRSIFEKYVPQTVLSKLQDLKGKSTWRIPPQTTEVSSLFIDLQGFTTITETLAPERIFNMLNSYIEYVTRIVGQRGGIVDNIIADEMVIFFPHSSNATERATTQCLLSALEIASNWHQLQKKLISDGYPSLKAGIGIHSGPASIGTVGSELRSSYTCLGDTINIASRLQSKTREHSQDDQSVVILISGNAFKRASTPIKSTYLGKEKIRGRQAEIEVFKIENQDAISYMNQFATSEAS